MLYNNEILISVIIPVYNVEKFVEDALLSICNQNYKNLEIIIVDDYSSDNTYEIVKSIATNDSRIKLFRNDKNLKIVKTLNFALEQAKGEFIARMDGDDISYPDRIKHQLEFLLENPQYDLVGCHVDTIDENGRKIGSLKLPISKKSIDTNIFLSSPVLHIWLARTSIYKKLKGYREVPGAEDYDFLLRMHTNNFRFTNLDSFEYAVRIRDGNTTSTIGFSQRLMSNYTVELYKERVLSGKDSFSSDNVAFYLKKYSKYEKSFEKSNVYLKQAILYKSNRRYIKMLFCLVAASFKSKFQFQYLMRRLLFKFIS
ncbi:glycosyltransferase family 2 protein [Acinetobacter ursingii]|uniref:glycosyltransferase family 2 protein n=1 Tax=Acinetobacter ursingii TaxID=108980 RepID=UPI0021CF113F|nr:glycosyltransferase [Acinetobacter ursingii]MEC6127700.1 glycosyltransferase [Acinetobacter ursingii]